MVSKTSTNLRPKSVKLYSTRGGTSAGAIDADRFEIEVVHLGENKERVSEAEKLGVESVPALVINEQPFHINFGAALADLK